MRAGTEQAWPNLGGASVLLIWPRCFFHRNWRWRSSRNRGRSWSAPARLEPPNKAVSVALSADGNTAIVGGPGDNRAPGRRGSSPAAAVSGPSRAASWSAPARLELPTKATPSRCPPTATPPSWAGLQRQLSDTGAAWVFTRSGGVWTQQGSKLVGTGAVGTPDKATPSRCPPTATPPSWAGLTTTVTPGRRGSSPAAAASGPSRAASWSAPARLETPSSTQGFSVALSADGNTAIVGGPGDNSDIGAAWVFTRSGGVWTQQGSKLVGTGAVGAGIYQGYLRRAVRRRQHRHRGRAWRQLGHRGGVGLHPQRRCLDPAGQQAGRHRRGWSTSTKASPSRCPPTATPPSWAGAGDNADTGAAWVYTRSGGVWTQQGSKLVGTGAVGPAHKATPSRCPPTATPPSWAGLRRQLSITGAAWVFVQLTKDDCKHGGWLNFIGPPGPFTNQGQCVSYFAKLE